MVRDGRRYEAVVFDLFGTLVPEFSREEFGGRMREMARALGIGTDDLLAQWDATSVERQTGRFESIEDNLRAICERLGVAAPREGIAEAAAIRAAMYRRLFRPLPGALETLAGVRRAGLATALVSMCAPDAPALWRASRLAPLVDVTVFSCEAGLRKPDPAIYRLAADRLGVEPRACLYVGDGSYRELNGAAAVGMDAVLIRDPEEIPGAMLRPDEDAWDGRRIASIADVGSLLA
jgi:putative hydrolase of the HAD superfamily